MIPICFFSTLKTTSCSARKSFPSTIILSALGLLSFLQLQNQKFYKKFTNWNWTFFGAIFFFISDFFQIFNFFWNCVEGKNPPPVSANPGGRCIMSTMQFLLGVPFTLCGPFTTNSWLTPGSCIHAGRSSASTVIEKSVFRPNRPWRRWPHSTNLFTF